MSRNLIAWLLRRADADAAAAIQRALSQITERLTTMSLDLTKLTADVARVQTGVADLRSQIATLSAAAGGDPALQAKIDAIDASLSALFPAAVESPKP